MPALSKKISNITIDQVRKNLKSLYCSHGMHDFLSDIDLILSDVLSLQKGEIPLLLNRKLSSEVLQSINLIAEKRLQRIPLQYLLGHTEFYGLDFCVTSDTFIPRPETEILIDKVLEHIKVSSIVKTVLEIGTGSGNIAVTLAKHCPDLDIDTVEINPDSQAIARKNAEKHEAAKQITFLEGDLFSVLPHGSCYDLLVSNPPYIPQKDKTSLQPEVRDYEPERALYGGNDGLHFIEKIINEGRAWLRSGAKMFLEIGHNQGKIVQNHINMNYYRDIHIYPDYNGFDRILELTVQ